MNDARPPVLPEPAPEAAAARAGRPRRPLVAWSAAVAVLAVGVTGAAWLAAAHPPRPARIVPESTSTSAVRVVPATSATPTPSTGVAVEGASPRTRPPRCARPVDGR
ncbi:hypothetical protein [Saccharothrix sp. HUAS TT1]|uniref:hypothetical protein n=1 Tax=unclassified Saccharothrix TaxID=2593673 RepID=UPI00345BE287